MGTGLSVGRGKRKRLHREHSQMSVRSGKKLAVTTVSAIDRMADLWAQAEQRAGLSETPDVPEAALSIVEYAKRHNIPDGTAQYRLKAMQKAGVLTAGKAYRLDARGHAYLTDVYWPMGAK